MLYMFGDKTYDIKHVITFTYGYKNFSLRVNWKVLSSIFFKFIRVVIFETDLKEKCVRVKHREYH